MARYSAYIRMGMSVWVCIHRVCACASGKVGHVHSCVYAYIYIYIYIYSLHASCIWCLIMILHCAILQE